MDKEKIENLIEEAIDYTSSKTENKELNLIENLDDFYCKDEILSIIKTSRKIININPFNKPIYDLLIEIYREIKDYEKEEDIIVEALTCFPNENKYKENLIDVARKLTKEKE